VLGFTRLPPWFEKEFTRFESVFADSRNFESFTALTSAVIVESAGRPFVASVFEIDMLYLQCAKLSR
jgi:hypothetical protein